MKRQYAPPMVVVTAAPRGWWVYVANWQTMSRLLRENGHTAARSWLASWLRSARRPADGAA